MASTTSNQQEDVEVRLVDQEKINEFGKLNNRLLEIRADIAQFKQDFEKFDDASAEIMMAVGGKVMLFMGESFVETSEDFATECE
jgi:prefoldin subunit 4